MRLSSAPTPGSCTSQQRKFFSGISAGDVRRRLAHAEADLQDDGRVAAEGGVDIQRRGPEGQR